MSLQMTDQALQYYQSIHLLPLQSDIIKMLSNICCFNTTLCSCTCLGLTRNKNVKIAYILIILTAFIITIVINASIHEPSQQIIQAYRCVDSVNKQECIKGKNTQILFFGISLLHLFLLCSMFCKSEKIKIINQGVWILKVLIIVLGCLLMRLLVGTTFFEYMQYISIWGANLLYIFQAIVFIDLIYSFDRFIDEKALENNKLYILKAILSITILLTASFICFVSFKHNPPYICIVNAILLGLFIIFAILRIFTGNSILVASTVGLCINIIGFYIEDHDSQQFGRFLMVFKGGFILLLLLGMLCQGGNKLRTRKSTINELLALNTNQSEEDNRYVSSNKWTVYHYIMMIITIAIPAALCWENKAKSVDFKNLMNMNNFVWWIATILLYIWSLICCRLFPEKDFSDLQNYFREYQLQ